MDSPPPIVVLARLDSRRLPGKALADVAGRPLLSRLVERLRAATTGALGPIVLATTDRVVDDRLAAWAEAERVRLHRSSRSADDVAGRFVDAARAEGGAGDGQNAWAFRVNGDSPMVDAELLSAAIDLAGVGADLVSNLMPRRFPYGVAVELVRLSALTARLGGASPEDREHVTRVLYRELPTDRIRPVPGGDPGWASVRATVDTPADLASFRAFVEESGRKWPITPLSAFLAWTRRGSMA